jgi:oligoribonuclease
MSAQEQPKKGADCDRLVWLDIETTGLNPAEHEILEIGIIVTNRHLMPVPPEHGLEARMSWLLKPHPRFLEEMAPEARAMHEASGLLAALQTSDAWDDPVDAQRDIAAFLDHFAPSRKSPLCGSSVHFDRAFLMAGGWVGILSRVHYRNIDVSTLKTLADAWGYEPAPLPPAPAHRALPDLAASISELAWYRERMLNPYIGGTR